MVINITLFLLFGIGFFIYKTIKEKIKEQFCIKRVTTEKVKDNMGFLRPGKSISVEIEKYYVKKIKLCFLIIIIFNTISFFVNLQSLILNREGYIDYLDRPTQGTKFYELSARIEEEIEKTDIVVQVEETWMNEEEVAEAFKKGYKYLEETILGENLSIEEVNSDLYFPDNIPNTDIKIVWETENFQYIDNLGSVKIENLKEDLSTYVKATLSYKDYKEEFQFHVKLVPKKLDETNKIIQDLNELVIEKEKSQKEESKVLLPKEINGKAIKFYKLQREEGQSILLCGFLLAIIIFVLHDIKLSEEIQRKNKVLIATYPEIVMKLTLLISAGMTIRRSWEKIVLDYKKKCVHNYAYEEMEVTYYEIQKGQSEGKSYGIFGKRCKLHQYIKLGGILEQNLKKGNRDLEQLLMDEVRVAFEERKNRAKQLGEEASTKLLMPMFLMLIVVLIICMAPAFMGF